MIRHGISFVAANGAQGSVYAEVIGCNIDASDDVNGGDAIRVESIGDLVLTRNKSLFMDRGMHICPATGQVVQLVQSDKCVWDTGDSIGIHVSPTGGTVRQFKDSNSWSATFDDAIVLDGTGTIGLVELQQVTAGNCRNNAVSVNSPIVNALKMIGGNYGQNVNANLAINANMNNLTVLGASLGVGGEWTAASAIGWLVGAGVSFSQSLTFENNPLLGNTQRYSGPTFSNSATTSVRNNPGFQTVNAGEATPTAIDGNGDITIAHGMNVTPKKIRADVMDATGAVFAQPHSEGALVFKVRLFNAAGAAITSGDSPRISWSAEW